MNKRFAAISNMFFSSSHAVFSIITGLVMVPLYLRYFDLSTYGVWLASGNIILMISLIEPGIGVVATQKMSVCYGLNDKARFSNVFGSALLLSCMFCLIVMLIGLSLSPFIPVWLKAPRQQQRALSLALCFSSVGAATSSIFYLLGAVPQAWQRTVVPGFVGLIALGSNVLTIIIGLYANLGIVALGMGSFAFSMTYIIGYLFFIGPLWKRLDFPSPTASLQTAVEIWHEAKMLLLAKIAGTIGKYLEAPVAVIAVSTEAAAILILTGKVITAVQMFADRVGTAVFAGMSQLSDWSKKTNDYAIMREVIVVSTVIAGFGIGLSLAFSESIISLWVGEKVFGGIPLLLLLALSSLLSSRKNLYSSLLVAMGHIKDTSMWMSLEALLRVIFILIFVLMYSMLGIPLADALASIITLFGFGYIFMKKLDVDKSLLYKPGIKGCAISLGLGILHMLLIPKFDNWIDIGIGGLLFVLLMVIANFMDREWVSVLQKTIVTPYKEYRLRNSTL